MSQRKRARKERRRESRSVQRELGKTGVMARLERVRTALREPVFALQLNDAIGWAEVKVSLRSLDQVRDLALGVLAGLGVDTDGVNLKMGWHPERAERQLDIRAVLEIEVAEKAIAAAKARDERAPA